MTDERKTRETREDPNAVRSDPDVTAISQAEVATPEPAHEVHDIGIRVMAFFILVVGGLMVLGMLASGGLLGLFVRAEQTPQPGSPIETIVPPDQVRLQVAPQSAMEQYRATAEAQLEGYGWADQAGGFARIPITRAITLVTQGVMPAAAGAQPTPAPSPAAPSGTPTATPAGG